MSLASEATQAGLSLERTYFTVYYPIWVIEFRADWIEHPGGQLYVKYVAWWTGEGH